MSTKTIIITNANYKDIPDLMQNSINNGSRKINLNFQPKGAMSHKKITDILSFLQKGVIIANDQDIKFQIINLPYCFLPNNTNIIANKFSINKKMKKKDCFKCFYQSGCAGIWQQLSCANLKPIIKSSGKKNKAKIDGKIEQKFSQLSKSKQIIVSREIRKKTFGTLSLLEILSFLSGNNKVFHASKKPYLNLKPHQATGAWEHGNLKAIYATEHPADSIFYSLHNPQKLNKKSFSTIYTNQKTIPKQNIFFATSDIINDFTNGFIHIVHRDTFQYINDELISKKEIQPLFIFETEKNDFEEKINPVPFLETEYNPNNLFSELEREIIRQFVFLFKKNATTYHGFDHIYRVSEIAFDLALNEAPKFANNIFLAACLHDLGKTTDGPEKNHGLKAIFIAKKLLKSYWPKANINFILKTIIRHEKSLPVNDPAAGCMLDADRLDLFRLKMEPKEKFLSTQGGKNILKAVREKYPLPTIYKLWPKIFKEFLTKNKINAF